MHRGLLESQRSTAGQALAACRRVVFSNRLLNLYCQVPYELVALVRGLILRPFLRLAVECVLRIPARVGGNRIQILEHESWLRKALVEAEALGEVEWDHGVT